MTNPTDTLIAGAAAANGDRDVGDVDDDEPPPHTSTTFTITVPPRNPAAPSLPSGLVKVAIPLKILFKYSTESDPRAEGMNTFWKGGIQNLEKEMEAYELLSLDEENTDE